MAEKRVTVYLLEPADRPYYQAQWVMPGTTRRRSKSLGTADPLAAEQARADLEYELNNGLTESRNKMTWDAFGKKYLEERYADYPEQSRVKVVAILAAFGEVNKPRLVADVSEEMVAAYAQSLRKKKRKAVTIQTHLAHLRSALRWAVRQKLLTAIPHVESVRVPKGRNIRSLNTEEFEHLLETLTLPWQRFARTAWLTGMRRNELFYLEWSKNKSKPWVNWKAARIELPAESTKAREDQWIPMHPNLVELLNAFREAKGRVFALSESPEEVSRKFSRMAKKAGLSATLHDLRRSFGTRYASVVPAQVLQKLMRHADIKTTLEYYVNLDDGLDAAILKA